MKIDRIAIVLRVRRAWEAIDLGFVMARLWFFELVLIWSVLALPVFLLSHWVFSVEDLVYASIIFWWFKPVYEKPMLYYLSRKLFADAPALSAMPKQALRINASRFFTTAFFHRLSFARSFVMPVSLLEGLAGRKRHERISVLGQKQGSMSQWLTIMCLHFEGFLYIAFFVVVLFLVPDNLLKEDVAYLFFNQPDWVVYLLAGCYLLAAGVIAPFYVAAGFMLYISRRTELEGWDIELEFKKMVQAQSGTASGVG